MPKRVRDYAKERARRDAKYQALGYKSYNKFETERRNKKAKTQGFKNAYRKRKALTLAEKLVQALDAKGVAYDDKLTPDDPVFWSWFRMLYSRQTAIG